ncbi:MAG TPA: BamA/TamA family outer membrane protein [Chitinispirillaceae bacterium]|nr:BamA/TamA family outer membrane protein [Chitinispirillaceae bacterium]
MHHFIFLSLLINSFYSSQVEDRFILVTKQSTVICPKKIDGFSIRRLRNEVKGKSVSDIQQRLVHLSDSLGYLKNRFEIRDDSSVVLYPGKRSIIKKETVSGIDSSYVGHLPPQTYPRRFDASEVGNRARQITKVCADNGFPFVRVTVDPVQDSSSGFVTDSLDVHYYVIPDELCMNAQPVLYGLKYCSPRLIYNDISIRSGDIYSLQKQLNSINRLKNRSYIAEVAAAQPQLEQRQYSPGNPASVVVPFQITDKSGLGVDGAAAVVKAADDKPVLSGSLRFSLLNVFHAGESAEFGYTGDKSRQLLNCSITKPWLFNLPLELSTGGGLEVIKEQYGYIYGNMQALTEIGSQWKVGFDLKGNEVTVSTDSAGESGHFYGAGFVITRQNQMMQQGVFSNRVYLEVGSGISRKGKMYNRTSLQFNAGVHIPVLSNQAIVPAVYWYHLMTKEEKLLPSEMYRIGGNTTLRGYADNELAFRTAFHGQFQYMLYLNKIGAVYLFSDGGIGFRDRIDSESKHMAFAGYGVGLRVPSRIGTVTLEWARNIDDMRSPGRIHIRYSGGVQ